MSALHLYNETKFMVIGNPVILEQSHAHNAPDEVSNYVLQCFWLVLVVVCTIVFLFVKVCLVSLRGDYCKCAV